MMTSETIELKFQMTQRDLISALLEQAVRSWLLWLVLGIFVLRLGLEIYYIVIYGAVPDGNVFSPWIAIALTFFVVFPFIVVRFRADPRLFDEQAWRFTDDGITFTAGRQSANFLWSALKKITLAGSFYQLYFSKQNVVLIPRRVFSNAQLEVEFKNLAKQKVKTNIR